MRLGALEGVPDEHRRSGCRMPARYGGGRRAGTAVRRLVGQTVAAPRDFTQVMRAVIRCGGETDTTGAIVGASVGAGVGRSGIPDHLLEDLIEWVRTVSWMAAVARRATRSAQRNGGTNALPLPISAVLAFNALFLAVVLVHGFRRLLPPY